MPSPEAVCFTWVESTVATTGMSVFVDIVLHPLNEAFSPGLQAAARRIGASNEYLMALPGPKSEVQGPGRTDAGILANPDLGQRTSDSLENDGDRPRETGPPSGRRDLN